MMSSGDYFAYSEFKYYILSYLIYAKENYPEIYAETMDNQALRDAFGEKSAFLEQLARTLLNRRS